MTVPTSCDQASPPTSRHFRSTAIVVAASTIALCLIISIVLLSELLHSPQPPHVDVEPPAAPALTSHVLLFIVDGLRYDLGTNPNVAPNYARHMREQTHAKLWADPVTMTSSALLSIGAGQRGDFMQLILNLNGRKLGFNDIIANAHAAGLKTALAGDDTWIRSFGKFDQQVVDANGMSIEMDNSAEIVAAAENMLHSDPPPNLLIAHVIAPDHQAHAYGTNSERYAAFMRKFDAVTQRYLDLLSDDWTVLVTSDHGQTVTGAHGTDTPLMRQCPLFVYGKGIRPGVDLGDIDQIDLGPTISVLLGLPVPAHGKGTAITEMLLLDDASAARVACADARRIERLALAYGHQAALDPIRHHAAACADPATPPSLQIASGRAAVRSYDRYYLDNRASSGVFGSVVTVSCLLLLLLLPTLLFARSTQPPISWSSSAKFLALASFIAALCVGLTYQVERFEPPWHNVIRAVLFITANGAMLYGAVRPSHGAGFFQRRPVLALALFPCALAWSYPPNASAEAIVVLLLGSAAWFFAPHADLRSFKHIFRGAAALPWSRIALACVAWVGLLPFAIYQEDSLPRFLTSRRWLLVAAGAVAVVLWLVAGARQRDRKPVPWHLVAAVAVSVASLVARRFADSTLGLIAIVLLPLLALAAAAKARFTLAFGLGFAAYAWVARDVEIIPVACGLLLLEAIGHAAGREVPGEGAREQLRPWAVATLTALLFGALYLARVGLQGGLDLTNIDYGAGGFGDPDVSQLRLTLSAIWKYGAAFVLLMGSVLLPLPATLRRPIALLFVTVVSVRMAVLAWILYACRSSYWTALRTFADTPSTLIASVFGALVLLVVALASSTPRNVEGARS